MPQTRAAVVRDQCEHPDLGHDDVVALVEALEMYGDHLTAADLLDEREFLLRKAIGWVLREVSRHDPDWVVAYVEPRVARLSGVTFREAVRRLPDDRRAALEALR